MSRRRLAPLLFLCSEGGDSTGGSDVALECTDPRWVYDTPGSLDVRGLDIDGSGHVRVAHPLDADTYQVLGLDPGGNAAGAFDVDTPNGAVRWSGVDDADNVVLRYHRGRRRPLRQRTVRLVRRRVRLRGRGR